MPHRGQLVRVVGLVPNLLRVSEAPPTMSDNDDPTARRGHSKGTKAGARNTSKPTSTVGTFIRASSLEAFLTSRRQSTSSSVGRLTRLSEAASRHSGSRDAIVCGPSHERQRLHATKLQRDLSHTHTRACAHLLEEIDEPRVDGDLRIGQHLIQDVRVVAVQAVSDDCPQRQHSLPKESSRSG